MGLPYENAISGVAALQYMQKLLGKFGCSRFGTMTDAANGCQIMLPNGATVLEAVQQSNVLPALERPKA